MQNICNLTGRNSVHIIDKFLIATVQRSMAYETQESLAGNTKYLKLH